MDNICSGKVLTNDINIYPRFLKINKLVIVIMLTLKLLSL